MLEQADVAVVPPAPLRLPVVTFAWKDVAFLHWRVDAEAVQRLLPKGLTVEEFDESAWVTLTPFRVEGARPPGAPVGISYDEANLRTYVRTEQGRRGIWFLALDATNLAVCLFGRGAYVQPYQWSAIEIEREPDAIRYVSERRFPNHGTGFDVRMEIGDPIETGPLETFLVGRWLCFAKYGPALAQVAIEHEPWPLRAAHVTRWSESVFEAAGLPAANTAPIAQFSEGVHAKLAPPMPVRAKRKQ